MQRDYVMQRNYVEWALYCTSQNAEGSPFTFAPWERDLSADQDRGKWDVLWEISVEMAECLSWDAGAV